MACTISKIELFEHPEISALMHQLHQHPAWRDSLSHEEIDAKLLDASHYAFFLTPAEQEGLFYIAFLDRDQTVHRHIFRIIPDRHGKWGYKNGAHGIYQDIDDLVVTSIGCTPASCYPCE